MSDEAPRKFTSSVLIVSCQADKTLWQKFVKLGFTVYSNELLLTGVLRQQLQLDQHKLAAPK